MSAPLSKNQSYLRILADIAMVSAVRALGGQINWSEDDQSLPGGIRDRWLAENSEGVLRHRAIALATAAVEALKTSSAEQLLAAAASTKVPLSSDLADKIAQHFAAAEDAILIFGGG